MALCYDVSGWLCALCFPFRFELCLFHQAQNPIFRPISAILKPCTQPSRRFLMPFPRFVSPFRPLLVPLWLLFCGFSALFCGFSALFCPGPSAGTCCILCFTSTSVALVLPSWALQLFFLLLPCYPQVSVFSWWPYGVFNSTGQCLSHYQWPRAARFMDPPSF